MREACYRSIVRCCTRLSFVNLWVVIYGLGIVWHDQPLVVFPAVFAALVAHGVHCWTTPLGAHGYAGHARRAHHAIVGGVLAVALVGLAATSTALARNAHGSHLRDAPLAGFFLIVAILAWRALVRPTPRRTSGIAVFIYATWLPFVVWNALGRIGTIVDSAAATDWQDVAARAALWTIVGAGGVVCWVVTLASAHDDMPVARVR